MLIDYVNFKGEGTLETERYNGQGWGLLQILEGMNGTEQGMPALEEFAAGAQRVLLRRVGNSPPERGEKRWIPGWRNRIKTYTSPEIISYYNSDRNSSQNGYSNLKEVINEIYRDLVCSQT